MAKNLIFLAKKYRISQTVMGIVIGCSQQTVSKKLKGKVAWSLKDVAKLCDFFNTIQEEQKFDIEQLFGDDIAQICKEGEE